MKLSTPHSSDILHLVDFFISLVSSHLTNSVFQHCVLLIEMVDSLFSLSVVVHRSLEEEAEEALYAVASCPSSEVAQQAEVKAERRCEDRVAADDSDIDLH